MPRRANDLKGPAAQIQLHTFREWAAVVPGLDGAEFFDLAARNRQLENPLGYFRLSQRPFNKKYR